MKIKELKTDHPRIYELAMLRQKEAGNEPNDEVELYEDEDCFEWIKTIEGGDFWNEIDNGNFDIFYQKYPHTNDLPLINPEMLEYPSKDPINKAWHDKFVTHPIMPRAGEITPEMIKKFADKFAPIQEAIKPDYYKFNIKGVNCDMFDIAEALHLPVRLFSALKYFRVKGDKAKQINDLEKSIQCITLEIESLKCQ